MVVIVLNVPDICLLTCLNNCQTYEQLCDVIVLVLSICICVCTFEICSEFVVCCLIEKMSLSKVPFHGLSVIGK